VSIRRIDERHANPRRVWVKLGNPEYLSSSMVERLNVASRVEEVTHPYEFANRTTRLEFDLLPHSMASVAVAFQAA
jgi:xylan 1,4-beta-xylosidase